MGARGKKSESHLSGLPFGEKRPAPQIGMTKAAREKWKKIVASLPATHFRPGDLDLLRAYCEAAALHAKAIKEIELMPVIETEFTVKVSPWVAVQTATASTMAQMATKLRLCVNSRQTNKQAGYEKETVKSKRKGLMFGEE